ncbi:MAG: hypothetical protein M3Y12_05050 [Bacteroidota bacterium]|nr:hypothetical protein [Bacteroidota bacterium]
MDFGEGEGITYRNSSNIPVGPNDPTDWTSDDEWNKRERTLFPSLSFDLNGTQRPALIAYASAYPNPAPTGIAAWALQVQHGAGVGIDPFTVQAVVVNRNYRVLRQLGPLAFGAGVIFRLDYPAIGLSSNELYRIHYVVYDTNGLVYKGHGDVRYTLQ